jgi:2-iminobutanoate/2-iminopropanoate deaminase
MWGLSSGVTGSYRRETAYDRRFMMLGEPMSTPPVPPYSPIRRAGDLYLTAGILGWTDGVLAEGGTEAQLQLALANLDALLASVGLVPADVVRLSVYLTDIADMAVLNEAFCSYFDEPRPARTTVVVAGLPAGASIEIEATAGR